MADLPTWQAESGRIIAGCVVDVAETHLQLRRRRATIAGDDFCEGGSQQVNAYMAYSQQQTNSVVTELCVFARHVRTNTNTISFGHLITLWLDKESGRVYNS